MRIVITGASGNVGSALLRALTEDPAESHQLVGISRRPARTEPPFDRAEWISADLSEPASADVLAEAFTGADAVVHLAWLIQPSYDREQLRRTNQHGTARVIEAVSRAGVPHLVHFSSVGVYSPSENAQPVSEDYPHGGVAGSPYSVDKAAAEQLLDEFESSLAEGGDPSTTVTRMRPGLILQGAAASEISRYFLPRPLPTSLLRPSMLRLVPFPTALNLQFVHADDVARAVLLVLRHRAGGAFNVATEPIVNRASWKEMFGGVLAVGAGLGTAAAGARQLGRTSAAGRPGLDRPGRERAGARHRPDPRARLAAGADCRAGVARVRRGVTGRSRRREPGADPAGQADSYRGHRPGWAESAGSGQGAGPLRPAGLNRRSGRHPGRHG